MITLSIGQRLRIVDYSHPHFGELINVRSVHADGRAGFGQCKRFPGRYISFCVEQVETVHLDSTDSFVPRGNVIPLIRMRHFSD